MMSDRSLILCPTILAAYEPVLTVYGRWPQVVLVKCPQNVPFDTYTLLGLSLCDVEHLFFCHCRLAIAIQ